jgi:hypothetical protein
MSEIIKYNKTNILNKNQCSTFIKRYKDLINGRISEIKHPKTRKIIKNASQIKFIYNKCKEMYTNSSSSLYSADISKISKSARLFSITNVAIDYEKEIKTLNQKEIEQIISIPVESHSCNRKLIKSLFNVPISYEKGLKVLKKYLNNPNNKKKDINEYRIYVAQIASMIPKYDPFMDRGNFTDSNIKMFSVNNKTKILLFSDLCEKEFISAIFQDSRKLNMGNFKNNENYTTANKNNINMRLSQNRHYYFSLYYIARLVIHNPIRDPEIITHMAYCKMLMRKLLNIDLMIRDPNVSNSFSTSSSENSNKEHDSTMNTIYKRIGIKEYVNYIMNNGDYPRTINDADPYLGAKWGDLSMKKLQMVVKISNMLNGRRYTYAFYAKSLYKDWKNSIKNRKPFINPITRVPFTLQDENDILNILDREYPNIVIPVISTEKRSDIFYQDIDTQRINGIYFWRINIWFNYGTISNPYYIRIVCINIITSLEIYDDENNFEYNPNILFNYYIEKLKNENKILGKTIPFKLHPAFVKYYNAYIVTEAQYLDFFRLISRSV